MENVNGNSSFCLRRSRSYENGYVLPSIKIKKEENIMKAHRPIVAAYIKQGMRKIEAVEKAFRDCKDCNCVCKEKIPYSPRGLGPKTKSLDI